MKDPICQRKAWAKTQVAILQLSKTTNFSQTTISPRKLELPSEHILPSYLLLNRLVVTLFLHQCHFLIDLSAFRHRN